MVAFGGGEGGVVCSVRGCTWHQSGIKGLTHSSVDNQLTCAVHCRLMLVQGASCSLHKHSAGHPAAAGAGGAAHHTL
jgi:hypothetical protein